MRIARNLRLSLGALAAHRVRSALALAGAAIGVAGVLVLTAVGAGARERVIDQIERLGRNMLVITPAQPDARVRLVRGGSVASETLELADAEALRRGSTHIIRVAPAVDGARIAKVGPIQNRATVLGTTPQWLDIRRFRLAEGRFFTDADNHGRERVAVLGWLARTSLFPDTVSPVGRFVRLGPIPFRVIGVLERQGVSASGTATEDDRIVIPLETAMHRVFGVDEPGVIFVEASSSDVMLAAERDATAILRAAHGIAAHGRDDFVIENQRVLLNAQLSTQASFQRMLTGLALLSLLVGGTGILSILLLSVRERRAEIGLRMAVGARRRDVLLQFLAEALLLAGVGGALGTVLGMAGAAALSALTTWDTRVTATTLGLACAAALLIGVGSGVLPAWRAAILDPIDALRSE